MLLLVCSEFAPTEQTAVLLFVVVVDFLSVGKQVVWIVLATCAGEFARKNLCDVDYQQWCGALLMEV